MILLDKVIIQNVPFYKLHSIDDFKEELLKYGYTDDMNVCFYNMYNDDTKTNIPVLCLEKTTSEPDFDYDWDENLEYIGENVMTTLMPFYYSMFNGKQIGFFIINIIHINDVEVDDLISEYKEICNKKRQNKYDVTRLKEIDDYLNDLFKLYPNIIIKKNDSILYNEDDSIKINDFLFLQDVYIKNSQKGK